jgi:hypothetical protein
MPPEMMLLLLLLLLSSSSSSRNKYSRLVSLDKELGTLPARPLLLRARNCKLGRVAQSGRNGTGKCVGSQVQVAQLLEISQGRRDRWRR